jgi:hypothetical protein
MASQTVANDFWSNGTDAIDDPVGNFFTRWHFGFFLFKIMIA